MIFHVAALILILGSAAAWLLWQQWCWWRDAGRIGKRIRRLGRWE
jgi:hypothetical protein